MLLAWSATEVVRYSFYGFTLLEKIPSWLLWLRYTTFYLLYPIGATSEAAGIYSTLPISLPWKTYDYFRAFLFVIWWPCKVSRLPPVFHAETNLSAVRTVYPYDEAKKESPWQRENHQTRMIRMRSVFEVVLAVETL